MSGHAYLKNVGLAIVVLIVPLLAGCGSSSSSSSSSSDTSDTSGAVVSRTQVSVQSGTLTKAQFIKQSDSICEDGRRQFEENLQKYLQSQGDSSLNALLSLKQSEAETLVDEFFVPIHEEEIHKVSALGAPSGDKGEVTAILESVQKGLGEAQQQPLKFVQTSIASFPAFAKAAKLATAYGLSQCGQS